MSPEAAGPRAAVYTRISLDKKGEGIGVERQERACRKLAEAHGCSVNADDVLSDNDTSAYTGADRPGFTALCEQIRTGQIDRVYVYSTDRLARRTRDLIDLMELMKPRGVIVHAVDGQGIDPNSANGVLITTILGAVAQQESAHKAERIRSAYQHRASTGKPKKGGRRMFGYEADGETIVEAEAKWIRKAAKSITKGTRSIRGLCSDMRTAGVTATTGKPMSSPTLRTILRNPYLAGLSTFTPTDERGIRLLRNREVVADGTWTPILDRDVWDDLQRALDRPDRKTNHVGNTPRRLMSGLLLCACGDPMYHRTRALKSGGKYSYYACKKTRKLDPGTTHVAIGADDTDTAVSALMVARLSATDIAALLTAAAPANNQAEALSGAHRDRRAALDRRDDLEAAYADGAVTLAAFTRTSARIDEQLSEIAGRIDALSRVAAVSPLAALIGVDDMAQWWERADLESRRAIVRVLVTISVGPGKAGAKVFDRSRLTVDWQVDSDS